MRPSRVLSLVFLWLLSSVPWVYCQQPEGNPSSKQKSVRVVRSGNTVVKTTGSGYPVTPTETFEVKGYGVSDAEAHEDALRKAQSDPRFTAFLNEQGFAPDWRPSMDDLRALVKEQPSSKAVQVSPTVGEAREVTLKFEMNPKALRQLVKDEREFRSTGRMWTLAKLLAVLVSLLTAVSCYFRLEEATKGYCTAWLRLGAVGFIGAVIAGLLFLA